MTILYISKIWFSFFWYFFFLIFNIFENFFRLLGCDLVRLGQVVSNSTKLSRYNLRVIESHPESKFSNPCRNATSWEFKLLEVEHTNRYSKLLANLRICPFLVFFLNKFSFNFFTMLRMSFKGMSYKGRGVSMHYKAEFGQISNCNTPSQTVSNVLATI